MPRKWSPIEDEIIERFYLSDGPEYCAKLIGRTPEAVAIRARRHFGLHRRSPKAPEEVPLGLGQRVSYSTIQGTGNGRHRVTYYGVIAGMYTNFVLIRVDQGYCITAHKHDLATGQDILRPLHTIENSTIGKELTE